MNWARGHLCCGKKPNPRPAIVEGYVNEKYVADGSDADSSAVVIGIKTIS